MATNPPGESANIQMLSVIAHVIGFDLQDEGQPPVAAPNAREADLLMFNWIAANATDEDIVWHFPTAQRYELELLRKGDAGWEPVWRREAGSGEAVTVTIPRGQNFGIPPSVDEADEPQEDDDVLEEEPPTIPLKQIVEEQGIPLAAELAVRFSLKADEFPQETLIPLWR